MTRIVWSFLIVFFLAGKAHAIEGIYSISGTSTQHGNYHGVLELRSRGDGTFQATRLSTYDTFRYENLIVQEVWSGVATPAPGGFNVSYTINQANFLTSVGAEKRTPEQFQTPIRLSVYYSVNPASFNVGSAVYSDVLINGIGHPIGLQPLWQNERFIADATGDSMPAIGVIPYYLVLYPVIREFRFSEYAQKFWSRPEFHKGRQYLVQDSTDWDFYRRNPGMLRVTNRVTDTISLMESILRHDSFAHSLTDKARFFDKNMQDRHVNELGMFAGALVNPDGTFSRTHDGDGALWTGMYAGSQAMRYLVTGEAEALENFKKSLRGVMLLMDITQDPSEFARYVQIYQDGQDMSGSWRRGTGPYVNYAYIEGGNNDMFKGVVQALAWALRMLPESETELLAEVRAHAARVTELKIAKKNTNRLMAEGLRLLASRDPARIKDYVRAFQKSTWPAEWEIENGFYYGGLADFSGVNLAMVSLVNHIVIADTIKRDLPFRKWRGINIDTILDYERKTLMENWRTYLQVRRDFLTVAANTFAYKFGARGKRFKQAEWDKSLAQSLWSLRDIPAPRVRKGLSFDYTMRPDFCLSAWPDKPWKWYGNDYPWEYYYQSAYDYPLFEGTSLGSTFIWKDGAFNFRGSAQEGFEPAPGDYLYVYWTARYGGMTVD